MKTRAMKLFSKFLLALLAAMVFAVPLPAQQEPAAPPTEQQPAMAMEPMDKMADSVTKMSEMCMMMMQKQMSGMPLKMGAAMVIGALLLVALLLFIVLEVQWIRYWSRILKERR